MRHGLSRFTGLKSRWNKIRDFTRFGKLIGMITLATVIVIIMMGIAFHGCGHTCITPLIGIMSFQGGHGWRWRRFCPRYQTWRNKSLEPISIRREPWITRQSQTDDLGLFFIVGSLTAKLGRGHGWSFEMLSSTVIKYRSVSNSLPGFIFDPWKWWSRSKRHQPVCTYLIDTRIEHNINLMFTSRNQACLEQHR